MPRPTRIETLEDIKTWITDHDARIDVYWQNQHDLNGREEKIHAGIHLRLTALEKKVIFWAGIAAGAGALLGGGGGALLKAAGVG